MTILPSDDAFGIISFAPDSLSRIVRESSGSTVYLTVRRTRGLLGPSNVYWQVSGPGAPDVENTNGFVLLSEFSNETQIAIRIRQDAVCCFIYYLLSLSPQSVCLSVFPSVHLSFCSLVCPSVRSVWYVHLSVSQSIAQSVYPSVSLSICLSVSRFLSLSVCPFVSLLVITSALCSSVDLPIYPPLPSSPPSPSFTLFISKRILRCSRKSLGFLKKCITEIATQYFHVIA